MRKPPPESPLLDIRATVRALRTEIVLAALGVDPDGRCPKCHRRLQVHDGWAGPSIRCRGSRCITGGAWAWPEWAAAELWNLDVEPAARRIERGARLAQRFEELVA